jgi:two-component system, OmpR family, sensor kinase
MPQKSIRLRLLLWFGFFLAVLIAGFGVAACQLQKIAQMEAVDAQLAQHVDLVSSAFRYGDPLLPPPPMFKPDFAVSGNFPPPHKPGDLPPHYPRSPVQLPDEVTREFSTGSYFAVWGAHENKLLAQSSPEVASIPQPTASATHTMLRYRTRHTAREAYQFTERNDCVLAGRDLAPELANLRLFAWKIAGIGFLVLLLGLGGEFLVSALLLDSIRQIGKTALRISEGNLAERIPTGDMDRELGQLADVLNATFARLDAAFARQQQFTADAAHELRTPLAVIISETQTALRRDRSAEEYRDTIHACEDAAQKMRRLADSLLELARLDAGCDQGVRSTTDLALVAQECIEQYLPLANQRGIRLQADLKPAELSCHPDQIGRVFANLIVNALDYTLPDGTVRISTALEHGQIVATVADTGEGIAPENLRHIFDRFYRAAPMRSRTDGHAGLGLAICKAIVEAHGGTIEASSTLGAGTVMTLRFPLARPAPD